MNHLPVDKNEQPEFGDDDTVWTKAVEMPKQAENNISAKLTSTVYFMPNIWAVYSLAAG